MNQAQEVSPNLYQLFVHAQSSEKIYLYVRIGFDAWGEPYGHYVELNKQDFIALLTSAKKDIYNIPSWVRHDMGENVKHLYIIV